MIGSANRILKKQELRQASVAAHIARQTSHADVTRQNTARQHDNRVNADPHRQPALTVRGDLGHLCQDWSAVLPNDTNGQQAEWQNATYRVD